MALEQPRSGPAPEKPLAVNADFRSYEVVCGAEFSTGNITVLDCVINCVSTESPFKCFSAALQYTVRSDYKKDESFGVQTTSHTL